MTRSLVLLGLLLVLALPSAVAAPEEAEPCEVYFIVPFCAPGTVPVTGVRACGVTLVPAACLDPL